MNTLSLTDTQSFVLRAAARHPDGRVDAFPKHVRGGAADAVLAALRQRALIRNEGDHDVLTYAGLTAVQPASPHADLPDNVSTLETPPCGDEAASVPSEGEPPASLIAPEAENALAAAAADDEASWRAEAEMRVADTPVVVRPTRSRACTKQATLIEMLMQPQGASIAQLAEALGWQRHSVRSALVTVIRKFGLTLHAEKIGGVRVYRVQAETAAFTPSQAIE